MTFSSKKQAKPIRLTGSLTIDINGTAVEVSNTFKLQTDLMYSGMSLMEQETVMNAYKTALTTDAIIKFSAKLTAEEIVPKTVKEPSAIDLLLLEINKPTEIDLLEAATRDDAAKEVATQKALEILGIDEMPKTKGS